MRVRIMVFGASIRCAGYADLGQEQLARKFVRRAGIGDDEDWHGRLLGMFKKRPEPARLHVGGGKRFGKKTDPDAKHCQTSRLVEMFRKPGNVEAEAMTFR